MRTGQPTNSFSTNVAKEYKETNAAESAATIVGSGVAVAAMVENVGDIGAAAEQVAAAAVAAAAGPRPAAAPGMRRSDLWIPMGMPWQRTLW